MAHFALTVVLGMAAALAAFLGAFILVRSRWEKRYLRYFVALGAGFMLATAFLEMIPESFRLAPAQAPALVFAGYCVMHLLEHTINPHFHYGEETECGHILSPRTGNSVAAGLAAHSLFDGVAIASGFALSSWLGWIVFAAILLHKMPEGLTVASVTLASGRSRGAALAVSAMVSAATLAGVLVIDLTPGWVRGGLPLSAGVAVYVGASDLVPEVNRETGIRMALVFFAGVAIFLLCRLGADLALR